MVKQTNYSFLPILDKENSRQDFNKITTLLEYLKIYIKKKVAINNPKFNKIFTRKKKESYYTGKIFRSNTIESSFNDAKITRCKNCRRFHVIRAI